MDLDPKRLDVCVVGTAAVDLVLRVPRLPGDGETVFAESSVELPGGKGLNQAVAAAHAGASVLLVSTAGDDQRGRMLLDALVDTGVDTAAFRLLPGTTGVAVVQVPPSGDSSVTLARTDTSLPTAGDIPGLHQWLDTARVTIVQLELDPEFVADVVHTAGGVVIGTLVPSSPLDPSVRAGLDVLVVNAAEAAEILQRGLPATTLQEAREAAEALTAWGPRSAVVTLGAVGAAYADRSGGDEVPAAATAAVDTAGAGDALLGRLAVELARDRGLGHAVTAGVVAGTSAVTRLGAAEHRSIKRGPPRVDTSAGSGIHIAGLSLDHIDAVEALIRRGEPYVRPRSASDYWLYSTLFSSTCPIAFAGDAVIGVVIAMRSQDEPADVYIQDVMIECDHRRNGLATALISRVRRRAEQWGCRRLYLTSEPDNRAAHHAWLAMGFRNVRGQELVDGISTTRDFKGPGKHRAVYELTLTALPTTPHGSSSS